MSVIKDNLKRNALAPPIEGEDYYIENGLYVFTAAYHLRRGYCCGSGCRHCPFDKEKVEGRKEKRF